MNKTVRKLMTLYKGLDPRIDIRKLYASNKGGRGPNYIEDGVDALIKVHDD